MSKSRLEAFSDGVIAILITIMAFVTGWMGETHLAPVTTAAYGVVMFMAAVAYTVLQHAILTHHGAQSRLAAIGPDWKGKPSLALYAAAVPLAFVNRWISAAIYVSVALVWLVPDRRIERGTVVGET